MSAKADTVTVYFNGSYDFANNGVGIPLYGGTMDGQSEEFYCVDYSHEIYGNTNWKATVTQIGATTNYSGTRLDNATDYMEIAWLLDQSLVSTNQTTQAELQWAVWSFSGGGNPYGTNSTLLTEALNAVHNGFTDYNWEILTPTGSYGQEFFVRTPEPSTLLMLSGGLIGLFFLRRRGQLCC
jgi:hypothetical protein